MSKSETIEIPCGPLASVTLPAKPRNEGITAAIDGGLPLSVFRDCVEQSSEFLDFVKFGWASAFITKALDEKIRILRDNGIDFWIGGTALEIAYFENRVSQFVDYVGELGAEYIEVSDGKVEFEPGEKVELISALSKSFRVFSEIGSKDVKQVMTPRIWISKIREELDAGAWKIIAEGRESGTVGIYRPSGEIREGLLEEIRECGVPIEDLVFEAPNKSQQVWLIERFSKEVNFGNIPLMDALNIAALRLGLRADTIFIRE
ncbi:MAG: phosphosulfolactate synthase [Verrucomicrobiales bacterium]|nr:phosphosulfolactate synthase [Verrucomicrobiales bacterium]